MQQKNTSSTSPDPGATVLTPEFLGSVSHGPGVYQMLGRREVLYVGKARDLRKRLSQYAHHSGGPHSRTAVMLSHVHRVETILTTTEKEALILEASLIKKHRPRYNVILRDDKNYPLIKVTTGEQWPRIVVTRRRTRDNSRYFGPYASTSAMRATLRLLYSMFPLRRCRTVRQRSRPCLNFQMGRCLAPCTGEVNRETYSGLVRDVLRVLEGRNTELIGELEERMRAAAAELAFEKAARYRDQVAALRKTLERQVIAADHDLDQDIFGLARQGGSVGIAILFVRAGLITGVQSFFMADPIGMDGRILAQTILQYYSAQRQPPRELLLPHAADDTDLLTEHLAELRHGPVRLHVPQRGRRMQLMRMAASNAEQIFSEREKKKKSWEVLADSLQKTLRLRRLPQVIECLDISNLAGRQAVGSLVCFREGEKYTPGFRHYRIRLKEEPDDYAMMREVLERRMETGLRRDNLPDMLLLDGGKGQLNIGFDVLQRYDLLERIDLVAIAKEKQDEGEKLFRPGRRNPILLPSHAPALLYLMRIRDEAHRFGITMHRRLRRKETLHSRLDDLKGVGEKRRKQLLRCLGSYKRIRAASVEELTMVPGIGPGLAASIHRQLQAQRPRQDNNKGVHEP